MRRKPALERKIIVMADTIPDDTNSGATNKALETALRVYRAWDDRAQKLYFDADWYVGQYSDIGDYLDVYAQACPGLDIARTAPLLDYLLHGWTIGRRPNPFFDPVFYLGQCPEIIEAGMNPLIHYVLYGRYQGLDPCAEFDAEHYLLVNPDVAEVRMDPLLHFLAYGRAEKRKFRAAPHALDEAPPAATAKTHFDPSSATKALLVKALSEKRVG